MSGKKVKARRKQLSEDKKPIKLGMEVPRPVANRAMQLWRLTLAGVLGAALLVAGVHFGISDVATLFTAGATG